MPIHYLDDCAVFRDRVPAEEAEALLQWLQDHPQATLDLGPCAQLHTSILQILLAARCSIANYPVTPDLRAWLINSMQHGGGEQDITAFSDAPTAK